MRRVEFRLHKVRTGKNNPLKNPHQSQRTKIPLRHHPPANGRIVRTTSSLDLTNQILEGMMSSNKFANHGCRGCDVTEIALADWPVRPTQASRNVSATWGQQQAARGTHTPLPTTQELARAREKVSISFQKGVWKKKLDVSIEFPPNRKNIILPSARIHSIALFPDDTRLLRRSGTRNPAF